MPTKRFASYICKKKRMNVYLLKQEGANLYKIGVTKKNPKERLLELATGNPNKLSLIYEFKTKHGFKLESCLHAYFSSSNVHLEWFELTDEKVEEFLERCEKYEKDLTLLKEFDNPFI